MILVLGKVRSLRAPNLGLGWAESPRWFDVSPKNSTQDMIHEWAHYHYEAASHQLPIATAFWIIWIVSTEECSSLMQNLMQIRCSTCLVILNAMATQYTCSLNVIYCPQWLVQWSRRCSHTWISGHFSWLLGYINATHSHYINNGWNFSKLSSYTILIKDNKFVEKCQEKGKGFWALRGGKLWEGKYMEKIMETRGFLLKFVQAHFGANIPFSNGN